MFQYAQGVLWRNLSQNLEHRLRLHAYEHTQQLPLAYFEDRSVGQLMAVLNDDINQLERFLDHGANDEIIRAAEIAEADEFIRRLPQGYDTVIGERGQKLSGGQQQRLAIARAVLKNPRILILDEATSAVDNETEAAIQRSLAKITQNRTTIIIAHRLSTVRHADCIYVLDQGHLVEWGQHEPLLDRRGLYHGLWQVQTGQAA